MRVLALSAFAVGLLLVVGTVVQFGIHTLQSTSNAGPVATILPGSDTPQAPVLVRAASPAAIPHPDPAFIEQERADLRPDSPDSLEYTPVTENVMTYRIRDGVRFRQASAYDGGAGRDPRPVIVLFHGAGRDELSMIDMWDEVADENGLLLLSLKSQGDAWDPNEDETEFLLQALERAAQDVPIDRNQVFLFGHSSGSIYAQLLANRVAGPWRAVAGHAGTLPAHWMQPNADAPPVRHYLGSSDGIFPPHDARISAETLEEMGHHSEFVLIPNHSHWFYVGGPAIAADAWDWFRQISDGAGT